MDDPVIERVLKLLTIEPPFDMVALGPHDCATIRELILRLARGMDSEEMVERVGKAIFDAIDANAYEFTPETYSLKAARAALQSIANRTG